MLIYLIKVTDFCCTHHPCICWVDIAVVDVQPSPRMYAKTELGSRRLATSKGESNGNGNSQEFDIDFLCR